MEPGNASAPGGQSQDGKRVSAKRGYCDPRAWRFETEVADQATRWASAANGVAAAVAASSKALEMSRRLTTPIRL